MFCTVSRQLSPLQAVSPTLFIEGFSPSDLGVDPNGRIGALFNERKRASDRSRSAIEYRNVWRRRLWLWAWGFDEGFEVMQGMASHEIIIDTDFLACHWGQVHHTHGRAFSAEMFRQSLDGLAHTRHGEDITVKNESYLTAVEANEVKISQQRCPTKRVFAFEVPDPKQAYGDSAMTRERISFLLAFSEPERNTRVCQGWLTARGTVKTDACPFWKQVFPRSALGVRLRLVRAEYVQRPLSIRRIEG